MSTTRTSAGTFQFAGSRESSAVPIPENIATDDFQLYLFIRHLNVIKYMFGGRHPLVRVTLNELVALSGGVFN